MACSTTAKNTASVIRSVAVTGLFSRDDTITSCIDPASLTWFATANREGVPIRALRITSYNVCYTKLLRG